MEFFDFTVQSNRPTIEQRDWMKTKIMRLVNTEEGLRKVVDECIQSGLYALDLECQGLDNRVIPGPQEGQTIDQIVGYCLSPDGKKGYYIPIRHVDEKGESHPTNLAPRIAAVQIKRLCNSDAVAIFHNAKFDQEFLEFGEDGCLGEWDDPEKYHDTFILAYIRNTRERNKGLKFLAQQELGYDMIELDDLFSKEDKARGKGKNFAILDPTWEPCVWYACSDAICTWELYHKIKDEALDPKPKGISHGGTQTTIYKLEKMCLAATRWMERCRIYIDRDKIEELIRLGQAEWMESLELVYDETSKILGRDIRPGWYRLMTGAEKRHTGLRFDPNQIEPNYTEVREEAILLARQLRLDPTEPDVKGKDRIVTIKKEVLAVGQAKKKETVGFPMVYDITIAAQLGLLLRELGVSGLKATPKSGQVKTSKDELDRVLEGSGDQYPFMGKVKRFREVSKALGTNLFPIWWDTVPEHTRDSTIRVGFNGFKVDTGRFSTPQPKNKEFTGQVRWNLQSIPATYDTDKPACMLRIREAIKARPGHVLFACIAEDSLVQTHRGLVPIQEIQVGDKALSEEGYHEITKVTSMGVKPVVKLSTYKGHSIRLTPDHRVWTTDSTGLVWKPAGELKPGDWVVSLGDGPLGGGLTLPVAPSISSKEKPISIPTSMSADLAEFLGRLMGDGCLGHAHGKIRYVGFALGNDEADVLPRLNRQALNLFGLTFTSKTRGDVSCWSQPLGRWLEEVTHKGSDTIQTYKVPKVILEGPSHIGASFLRGLFDADGSVGTRKGDGVSIWITSTQMALEVQLLLLQLGISCRRVFTHRNTNFGSIDGWVLTVTGQTDLVRFEELVGLASSRKALQLRQLVQAGKNRDISNHIPLDLAQLAIRKQGHPKTNAVLRNGTRKNRVSRAGLAACQEHPEDLRQEWVDRLLKGNLVFDTVTEISPDGESLVYDLTVPAVGYFSANGVVVHNCDFSGVELRIATNLSREPKWLNEFFRCSECEMTFDKGDGRSTPDAPPPFCPNCGSDKIGDLHTLTAVGVYGEDVKTSKDFKQRRKEAKGLNFAMVYGGGAQAAQAAVGVDKDEGYRIKRQFDATYTGLRKWWGIQHNFARKYGYVITTFGRRYPLPDIDHENGLFRSKAERNAVNGPVQGFSADITKLAMALIYKEMKKRGWLSKVKMTITIHDELVLEIEEDIAEEAIAVVEEIMTVNKYLLKLKLPVPLSCDNEFGDDWTVPNDLTKMRWNKCKPGTWNERWARVFPKTYQHYLSVGGKPIGDVEPEPELKSEPEKSEPEKSEPEPKPGEPFVYILPSTKLTYVTANKLAHVLDQCLGRGTQKLVIQTDTGEILWDNPESLVSAVEFQQRCKEQGL